RSELWSKASGQSWGTSCRRRTSTECRLVRAGLSVRNIRCVRGVFVDGDLPAPLVRVPETPPDLPLDYHTRAGFSSARRARRKVSCAAQVFRRSNGGDWTER